MKKAAAGMAIFMILVVLAGSARAEGKADEAMAMVKKASACVQTQGKEKAIAQFNDPAGGFVKGEFYIFAVNLNDCITLANGGNPKLVGKSYCEMKDADGKYFQKEFMEVAKKGGGWVDYKWTNPETKKIGDKSTYVEQAGDMVLGCGFYK